MNLRKSFHNLVDFGNIVVDEADVAAGVKVKVDEASGDLLVYNVDTATLYVSSEFAGSFGTEVAEGKFAGINAFATTKDAYMAARNIGGEITIDLTGAGVEDIEYISA